MDDGLLGIRGDARFGRHLLVLANAATGKRILNHRIFLPSVLLPTLGFAIASLGYHDWTHLGAEYDEIARAIYNGRGFSDPFGIETGPTAWMPPVLPYLMAAGYLISGGDRQMVMVLFMALQWLAIASSVALVLREAVRLNRYGWGLAVAFVGLGLNFNLLFCVTHDHALLILLVNALYIIMTRGCDRLSSGSAMVQGIFGGFAALCNPILATVWAVWIAVMSRSVRTVLVAAAVSIAVITPWTIRNYIVFDRLVPIKSAAKFEFFQALCISRDGILGPVCFWEHPWGRDNAARREYGAVGESSFIEARGLPASQKWRKEPIDCVDRIINRFLTATLWSETPTRFGAPVAMAMLNRFFYAWPFISLAVLIVVRSPKGKTDGADTSRWQLAALIYAGVLLPYVLISYYTRYAAPLLAIKCLLVLFLV
ncbi:MAG: hypothetical protein WBD20_03600, partial [Pirellulaceae bacterium]